MNRVIDANHTRMAAQIMHQTIHKIPRFTLTQPLEQHRHHRRGVPDNETSKLPAQPLHDGVSMPPPDRNVSLQRSDLPELARSGDARRKVAVDRQDALSLKSLVQDVKERAGTWDHNPGIDVQPWIEGYVMTQFAGQEQSAWTENPCDLAKHAFDVTSLEGARHFAFGQMFRSIISL
jgi:hypothetical protein